MPALRSPLIVLLALAVGCASPQPAQNAPEELALGPTPGSNSAASAEKDPADNPTPATEEQADGVGAGAPGWWRSEHHEVGDRLQAGASATAESEEQARARARAFAIRDLAQVRRVTILGELESVQVQELHGESLYEASAGRDRLLALTAQTLGDVRIDREQARPAGDGQVTVWLHASAPVDRLYPHRRLRALLASRPAGDAGDAPMDPFCRQLEDLAAAYAGEGESALAEETLAHLVRLRGNRSDCRRLAETLESDGRIAGALAVWQRLLIRLGDGNPDAVREARSEVERLEPLLRTWDDLVVDLLRVVRAREDSSSLRLYPPQAGRLYTGQPAQIGIWSRTPRVMALFWIDRAGLYRWGWRGAPPTVAGRHALTARASDPGQLTIVAIASPAAISSDQLLPVERAAIDRHDLSTIRRFEQFIAAARGWLSSEAKAATLGVRVIDAPR